MTASPARWRSPCGNGLPRSGTAFLRRATRTFGELQSVVYREHLAADPTHAITTLWTLAAPGSVEYAIAGGAQGIVIGRRRWDRPSRTAPWTLSVSDRLTQPAPPWGTRSRDARIMRESPLGRDAVVGRSGDSGVVHGDLHAREGAARRPCG